MGTLPVEPFFCLLDFGVQLNLFTTATLRTEESSCCREVTISRGSTVLKKPLHESSKIFVEHALHVTMIKSSTQA